MNLTADTVNASQASFMDSRNDAMDHGMALHVSVPSGTDLAEHEAATFVEPYVGMEFEGDDAAEIYCTEYAKIAGFSMHVLITRRFKHDRAVIERNFVCSKVGSSYNRSASATNQSKGKEACRAMIRIKEIDSGKWIVTIFDKCHNHELMPSGKYRLVRPQRYTSNPLNNSISNFDVTKSVLPFEPYIGMRFESEEAARVFYDEYAKFIGFTIRVGTARRSKNDRQVISHQFVCSSQGFPGRKSSHKRPIINEGCKAMIRLKLDSGKWVVTGFEKYHNHVLVPGGKVSLLPSHMPIPDTAERLGSTSVQVGPGQSKFLPGDKSLGSSKTGFNSVDLANCIQGAQNKRSLVIDAQCVLDYFKHMQARNPAFFYAIQADEGDHVSNVFWADARSRMAYSCFGDVVMIDTGYRVNSYGLPFILFTGVDHHKHAVLFGCGILLDERESSFIWLFNTWLKAMSGRYPDSLITCESPAISAAMAFVFPRTQHRLCKRHILRKFCKKFCDMERANMGLKEDFFKCINMISSNNEFESLWQSFIDKYQLGENQWLQYLFQNRDRWIQVYFQDVLLDTMPVTQISESISMLFDVDVHTTLMTFVKQCEKAMDSWYEKALEEDYRTIHTKPDVIIGFPMEIQVAEIYTRSIFLEFQEQLVQSLRYTAEMTKEEGPISTFRVIQFGKTKGEQTVTYNALEVCAICSCQMFEYAGILCRHILRVFIVKNVMILPAHYVIKRWTRNAMNGDVFYEHGNSNAVGSLESRTWHFDDLCHEAINFAAEGACSLNIYTAARSVLRKALDEIRAAKEKVGIVAQCTSPAVVSIQESNICEGT